MIFEPFNPLIQLLISFISIFYFLSCRLHFLLYSYLGISFLGALVSGTLQIIFLIFIAGIQVYVRLFLCIAIYLANLLSSFLSSRSFTWMFFRFFYLDHTVQEQRQFYYFFFFPIHAPFISFTCLIVLARAFSTMLSRSGENKHL